MDDYKITASVLILIFVVTFLIKNHVLLMYCMLPLIVVSDFLGFIPPLFSIGEARIRVYDFVIFVIGVKVIFSIIAQKRRIYKHPVYKPVLVFLCIMLVMTLLAYIRFDTGIFVGELTSFFRLLSQVSVLFLLIVSIKDSRQMGIARFFDYIGYSFAGLIYLDYILIMTTGTPLGEVQTTEEITRYFGIIGDQVGFILIFFILKSVIDNNLVGLIVCTGALISTGTRGALFSLVVGLIALAVVLLKGRSIKRKRVLFLITVVSVGIIIMVLGGVGTMGKRFPGYHFIDTSLSQRLILAKLSLQIFIDNALTGVGYTGFRYLALDYGAWQIFSERLYFSPIFLATTGNQYLQVATDGGIFAIMGFVWMMVVFLRTLKTSAMSASGSLKSFYLAGYIWLMSLLIGNQSAAWLLPGSLISYLMWIILGLAIANEQNLQRMERNYRERLKVINVSK